MAQSASSAFSQRYNWWARQVRRVYSGYRITVTSAKRSVESQAHATVPRAAAPGCSQHNYGIAKDVQVSVGRQRGHEATDTILELAQAAGLNPRVYDSHLHLALFSDSQWATLIAGGHVPKCQRQPAEVPAASPFTSARPASSPSPAVVAQAVGVGTGVSLPVESSVALSIPAISSLAAPTGERVVPRGTAAVADESYAQLLRDTGFRGPISIAGAIPGEPGFLPGI